MYYSLLYIIDENTTLLFNEEEGKNLEKRIPTNVAPNVISIKNVAL